MVPWDILCLANSRKLGGRCIAGLRTDGGGWVRVVSSWPEGTLHPFHYKLQDGSDAAVLDVLRIGITEPKPTIHHPENWAFENASWGLVERPLTPSYTGILEAVLSREVDILYGQMDRIPFGEIRRCPLTTSLALVAPRRLELYCKDNVYSRKLQVRGKATVGWKGHTVTYNLAVTDPVWETRVVQQGYQVLHNPHDRFIITVSLSEPFEGRCFKLIAAIIPLPERIALRL